MACLSVESSSSSTLPHSTSSPPSLVLVPLLGYSYSTLFAASAKNYRASGAKALRQDPRYGRFTSRTPGVFHAWSLHSLAPGASGCIVAQPACLWRLMATASHPPSFRIQITTPSSPLIHPLFVYLLVYSGPIPITFQVSFIHEKGVALAEILRLAGAEGPVEKATKVLILILS